MSTGGDATRGRGGSHAAALTCAQRGYAQDACSVMPTERVGMCTRAQLGRILDSRLKRGRFVLSLRVFYSQGEGCHFQSCSTDRDTGKQQPD